LSAPRLVVVGSTMIDLVAYADPLPGPGETVVGREFQLGFGGKGANQAVMASQLGADVIFVNRVGDDLFGGLARENMETRGIDPRRIRPVEGQSTGVAPIWVERDGTNRIIIVPGANHTLDAAAVSTELADIDGADCVLCQLEIPQDGVAEAFRFGRVWGATTILNPAPAAPLSPEVVALVDWLIPNETEFAGLTGEHDIEARLAEQARALGCGVIVTLGERGAATTIDGRFRVFAPPAVEPVDTTGAGDAFVGGFAWSLARGSGLEEAIAIGNACGALSTTRPGTQVSFPTYDEVVEAVELGSRVGLAAAQEPGREHNREE
jgi:ribokinase